MEAPITLCASALVFGFMVLGALVVDPSNLVFHTKQVFEEGEWWRIFTSIFFISQYMNVVFITYVPLILAMNIAEKHIPRKSTWLFFLILLFVGVHLFRYLFGSSVNVAYVFWISVSLFASRVCPDELYWDVIPIRMKYMQWIYLLFFLFDYKGGIIAFCVAHIAFYLLFVLPVMIKFSIFRTPTVLKWLCREME
jgi:hypothetical protein